MLAVLQQGAAAHQVRGFGVFCFFSENSSSFLDALLAATGLMFEMVQ